MVLILMMSAKIATQGLLKINIFWKKVYHVITFFHDAKKKMLSQDSSCIVDVVIWPKFGNSSVYIREVIIDSIL